MWLKKLARVQVHYLSVKYQQNPKTDISALKSVFGFRVRLQIRNPDFQNLNPDFPIERTLRQYFGIDFVFRRLSVAMDCKD